MGWWPCGLTPHRYLANVLATPASSKHWTFSFVGYYSNVHRKQFNVCSTSIPFLPLRDLARQCYSLTITRYLDPNRRTHFEKVVSQLADICEVQANDKNSAPSSPFLLGTMTTERIPGLAAARIINRQEYDSKNTDMHILDKWGGKGCLAVVVVVMEWERGKEDWFFFGKSSIVHTLAHRSVCPASSLCFPLCFISFIQSC